MLRKRMISWQPLIAIGVTMFIVGCPTITTPPDDPCAGVDCTDGETCVDGVCVAAPVDTTDPVEFTNADGIKGGALYDKFYDTPDFDKNTDDAAQIMAFGDFFRCKQCHAWDHLGNMASYIDRAPKTTRPNVTAINLAEHAMDESAQELFDAIKTGNGGRRSVSADLSTYDPADPTTTAVGDQMPNFGEILTDAQIWDLVKYLKEDFLDTTQLYDIDITGTYPDGTRTFSNIGKDGDPVNGDALYAAKCAGCHGADGLLILFDNGELSIGSFARTKPYELSHKSKFGQPGSAMGPQGINTIEDMKDLFAALVDSTNFPDPAPAP